MKLSELISTLQEIKKSFGTECDPIVVLSKDGEGNGYSPCADFSKDYLYVPENTWRGEIWDKGEINDPEYGPGEVDSEPCVVLWPTN